MTELVKQHKVPVKTRDKIKADFELVYPGAKLVFVCYSSNHPSDSHNFLVVGFKENMKTEEGYFTVGYNSCCGGFNHGDYNLGFKRAMMALADRLWDCCGG